MPKGYYIKPSGCKFNKNIGCTDKSQCARCGWNPAIANARLQEIRENLKTGGAGK